MQFTTQIPIPKSDHPIDYDSRIVSLGSCFAVTISERLGYYKFRNSVNPFGILFHPVAIERLVSFAVSGKQFSEDDIFYSNDCWHCFDAHSDLNAIEKDEILLTLNTSVQEFRESLSNASHMIITLGTAWVYRNILSDEIVANCHKVPQKQFVKELLPVDAILQSLTNTFRMIQALNPDVKAILTVSPVRHIKDGFTANQWSKSNLISAVHQFIGSNQPMASYFPSYEIMMDELRDYRFYAQDMLHPNQIAMDYIWQRFSEATVTEDAAGTMKTVSAIQKGLSHRPFNPDTKSHQDFKAHLKQKIAAVQEQFPHVVF